MDDRDLMRQINELVDEEHELLTQESRGEINDPGRERMRSLEVQLDQLWDLLRQRRARRDFGGNPDEAQVRPPNVVETYDQ
jgi:hypothetical protein